MAATLWPVVLVAGCGTAEPPPPPPPPVAQRLADAYDSARSAWDQGGYTQAAALYDALLRRAEAADDATLIARAAFEGALAHLRAGDPATASARAVTGRDDALRRGHQPSPVLFLVDAAARYRLDDLVAADALAAQAIAAAPQDSATAARGWFLRGLVGAERGDRNMIDRALSALLPSADPEHLADRLELAARRDLADGNWSTAREAALRAAPLRRQSDDLFGMARALAVAAEAADASGDATNATDLYFRAGRTALRLDRPMAAHRWLTAASVAARAAGLPDPAAALGTVRPDG